MNDMNNGNGKLDALHALRRREADIRTRIAAEQAKRKAREGKERERLEKIVGAALLKNAEQCPDFAVMLRGTLATTAMVESDKTFLRASGWLSGSGVIEKGANSL